MPKKPVYDEKTRQAAAALLAAKLKVAKEKAKLPAWVPKSRPQDLALRSTAHELFYGGGAGGGKSDLILGAACTVHKISFIFRREFPQLAELITRSAEIYQSKWPSAQYNKGEHKWSLPGNRFVTFGSMPNTDDWKKFQGRARDLTAFDEVTQFLEDQYVKGIAWARTIDPDQFVRVIAAGNPPLSGEKGDPSSGQWVIRRWAPWLDPNYKTDTRAAANELRWFATLDAEEVEVENGNTFEHKGRTVRPRSRTYIPARVTDNPYLATGEYLAVLDSLPEPLRSLLLHGFDANIETQDDPWQVIPTAWVDASMLRWRNFGRLPSLRPSMLPTGIGADVARGGADLTTVCPLYDNIIPELITEKGRNTPDGLSSAKLVARALGIPSTRLDDASATFSHDVLAVPIMVDIIGPGSSTYDVLRSFGFTVFPVHGNADSGQQIRERTLFFQNLRAEMYWRVREALDPDYGTGLLLPFDNELREELIAARWRVSPRNQIQVLDKPSIAKQIGRSPDKADAVCMSLLKMEGRHVVDVPTSTSYRNYGATAPDDRSSAYRSTDPRTELSGPYPMMGAGGPPPGGAVLPGRGARRSTIPEADGNYPYYDPSPAELTNARSMAQTKAGRTIFVPGYGDLTPEEVDALIAQSGDVKVRRNF